MAETSFTYVALVRLLSRVNTKMVLEVGIQSEPLLADFAFKRPFPCMGPHMTIEVSHFVECLCADVASKFFFPLIHFTV